MVRTAVSVPGWSPVPRRRGRPAARVGLDVIASAARAHVTASRAAILLMLGINRLAQAAVITSRALTAGVPFAAEKDGRGLLSGRAGLSPRHGGRAGQ